MQHGDTRQGLTLVLGEPEPTVQDVIALFRMGCNLELTNNLLLEFCIKHLGTVGCYFFSHRVALIIEYDHFCHLIGSLLTCSVVLAMCWHLGWSFPPGRGT